MAGEYKYIQGYSPKADFAMNVANRLGVEQHKNIHVESHQLRLKVISNDLPKKIIIGIGEQEMMLEANDFRNFLIEAKII